jgi:hypothetical protein
LPAARTAGGGGGADAGVATGIRVVERSCAEGLR